ncbi:MAG TPA: CPBP family glutamic-type intramembrane protease, partial [Candidatus Acidoferrales bacterium]|nr:CPBP family glutamic-type intramembrane protease [Candidatus Acidoferrales bacterium]
YIMPLVGSGLLYATILISQLQEAHGVKTGSLNFPPKTSPYVILLNLAFAPLNEEFAFRITTIGIPLAVYLIFRYASTPNVSKLTSAISLVLLTMFSPEMAKAKMGYRTVANDGLFRGISPLEWVLILLSSFVFGAAHLLLGGGWEIGKVSTAFLAGFVFAIMYVSYGAYADILLHWLFNYYFTVLDMANTAYGGLMGSFVSVTEFAALFGGVIVLVIFLLTSGAHLVTYFSKRDTVPVS